MLRHGGLVRLHPRSLRHLEGDRRAQAAARCARPRHARGAGRQWRLVPPSGHGLGRDASAASRRAPPVASSWSLMNLAILSVSALVIAIIVSCVTSLNVGVLAMGMAWVLGVYFGGMPIATVIAGFPTP